MNKNFCLVIFFIFLIGCSIDNKSGIWSKNEKIKSANQYKDIIFEDNKELSGEGKNIGVHPVTNKNIFLKVGRYGRYLETETVEGKTKRSSIPKNVSNDELNLEKSINFLTLPRTVGTHPETKKEIIASIGPYLSLIHI